MKHFSPPANIGDMNQALRQKWSEEVHRWFKEGERRLRKEHGIQLPWFFNLLDSPQAVGGPEREIPWNGFPRKYFLTISNLEQRWQRVEQLFNMDLNGRQLPYFYQQDGNFVRAEDVFFRDQDEYCEWKSFREPNAGKLQKVIFTCESPEYWRLISENDRDLLLELYRKYNNQEAQMNDLFFDKDIFMWVQDESGDRVTENHKGKYNPHNKWNSDAGIMHLSHPANSLSAEVFLAADATVVRKHSSGGIITSDNELICCAGYGSPNRSSDPTIGSKVNALIRQGLSISINDPVGLYIHSLDSAALEIPDHVPVDDCWQIVRGQKNMILRAEFRVPPGAEFELEDIQVGGEPLKYGAQLAEFITMVIFGKGFDFGLGDPPTSSCLSHCCNNQQFPTLQYLEDIKNPCPAPAPVPFSAFSLRTLSSAASRNERRPVITKDFSDMEDYRKRI